MPVVQFVYPGLDPLLVYTGANQISWSYKMNTRTFPTYGGEVVQILSIGYDDLTITGNTLGYRDVRKNVKGQEIVYPGMETIYKWFLQWAQQSTQGATGPDPFQAETGTEFGRAYNQTPIAMLYPERGWSFQILPKAMPGFKYGRDVVAPEWRITAHIVQNDSSFDDTLIEEAQLQAEADKYGFQAFGTATADIGYKDDNPFSSPDTKKLNTKVSRELLKKVSDYFNQLIPSYLDGTFDTLHASGSKPSDKDYRFGPEEAQQVEDSRKKKK